MLYFTVVTSKVISGDKGGDTAGELRSERLKSWRRVRAEAQRLASVLTMTTTVRFVNESGQR